MESATQTAPVSNKLTWTGRIISALLVLLLLFSGSMKVFSSLRSLLNSLGSDIPRA